MGSLRVAPEELIDLGDRVALRAKLIGVGRNSGVETARTLGYVCHLSARGLIARQEGYWEWGMGSSPGLTRPRSCARSSGRLRRWPLVHASSLASNSSPRCIH